MGNILSNKKKPPFIISAHICTCTYDPMVKIQRQITQMPRSKCPLCSAKEWNYIDDHHCIIPMKNKYMNISII